ncbi:hypothetical protein ACIPRL_29535 [Streptomyces sp. NPDC090085]|uniref:hypothetical protein n=1 Tax=Streptomyces sp. NPDC090085 TaxID=3365943 RepID=UPI00380BBCEC
MTHCSALFAAVLGLGRAGSNVGDHFVQSDYCARVKGATDDKPVHFATTPQDEPTVHGTSDGIKACAWHVLSVWLVAGRDTGRPVFSLIRNAATRRIPARQLS